MAPTPRPVLEEFEPRILYAADLAAVVQGLGDTATAGAWQSLATSQPTAVAAQEIAFVDLSLPDAQTLVAGLQAQRDAGRTIDIVTIAPDEDGLAVIARALEGRIDVSAIHLLGHGSHGVVHLGSVQLDAELLLARAGEVADWSRALTADADLLIYGCEVAASEAGRELVQSLAALSGADVAASDDLTGHVALGGDWQLEVSTGPVQAALAADAALQQAYAGVLAITDTGTSSGATVSPQTVLSFTHTVAAGANGLLVVQVMTGNAEPVTSVSFNGSALTKLADASSSGSEVRAEFWILKTPPVGNSNVVVTTAAGTKIVAGATSFAGVDQTTPTGPVYYNKSDDAAPTLSLVSSAGERVLDVAGALQVTGHTVGPGQTQAWINTNGSGSGDVWAVSSTEPGAASVTMSHSFTSVGGATDQWVMLATTIKPAGRPVITSHGGGDNAAIAVAENTTSVATVAATDPDGPALSYSIVGGADAARFDIVGTSGVLSFKAAPDHETPLDVGGNNVYDLVVRASDGALWDEQALAITVTDVGSPLVVTTTADTLDGNVGSIELLVANPGIDGLISLREAISAANNTPDMDTIVLPGGTYTMTRAGAGEDLNATGDFDITSSLRIMGSDAGTTVIDAGGLDRVFSVFAGTAAFSDLTIRGGNGGPQGGGINVEGGATIDLDHVIVSGNVATSGSGIYNAGSMTLTDVRLTGNGDASSGSGGGLNNRGTAILTRVTVDNNTGTRGAGIYSSGSALTIDNSTISSNVAIGIATGGGIYTNQIGYAITNSTIANNSASFGGGIYSSDSNAFSIGNTLLASNAGGNNNSSSGTQLSLGYNLDTDGSTGMASATDKRFVAANLGALAANGGFAPTHALQAGSAAIDSGNPAAPATDQRGVARASTPDIGAYEFAALVANRAPVNAVPAAQTLYEDTLTAITGVSVSDPDQGGGTALNELSTVALGVSNGTLQVTLSGAAALSAGANATASLTLTGPQADINTTLATLRYQGNNNYVGGDTLVMISQDGAGLNDSDNVAITVTGVNDPPRGTDATLTLAMSAVQTLNRASFGYNDAPGEGDAFVSVLLQPPSAGTLRLNGAPVTVATEVTVAQLDAGLLQYQPVTAATGTPYATLGFQVRDSGGTDNGGDDLDDVLRTLTFNVVNGPPVITSNGGSASVSLSVAENSTTVTTVTATDPDGDALTYSIVGGADAAHFRVDPASGALDFVAAPSFEVRADSGANNVYDVTVQASDGSLSTNQAIAVTVTDIYGAPGAASGTLWFTTAGNQTTAAGGATWSAGQLLQYGNAGDRFDTDGGLTTGTVDVLAGFAAPVPVRGLHYVQTKITIGTTGVKFTLNPGDLLMVLDPGKAPATVTLNTGDGNALNDFSAERQDIVVFRPAAAGNYTSGEYFMLLENGVRDGATKYNVHALSLVEADTVVGGTLLPAGTFVVAHSDPALHNSVYTFTATGAGKGAATATSNSVLLIDGNVLGLNGQADNNGDPYQIQGLHLLTQPTAFNDQVLTAGTLLVAVNGADIYAGVAQDSFDIVALTVTRTAQNGGTLATGQRLFDGSDLGLTDIAVTKNLNGFTVVTGLASNSVPVNTLPLADPTATEDLAFTLTLPAGTFTDADAGDTLSYAAARSDGSALPAWLAFNPATRSFSGTPLNADVGVIDLRVTATDSSGANATDDFTLTVANSNDMPTLATAIADQGATEGAAWAFTFNAATFADVDAGDTLSYSATLAGGAGPLPAWLGFNPTTRTFSGTPANADVGPVSVRVTATDSGGLTAFDEFTLTVANTNDAPTVAAPMADQSATEDLAFTLTLPAGTFTDADAGDTLTYAATRSDGSALPAWLVFNPATRSFSGTPVNADVGVIALRVTATDTGGANAIDDFTLTVANSNDMPTLATAIADQNATEDAAWAFTFGAATFADVDAGDTLSYSATLAGGAGPLPAWLGFDPTTRTFSGTPANADVGPVSVRVIATDSGGLTAFDEFTLTVDNVNDPPTVVTPIADRTATEDTAFAMSFAAGTFADVDAGDGLTTSVGALPGWLSFNPSTRSFSGTPGNADVGRTTLTVTVTDAAGTSASTGFDLVVVNANDAPSAAPLANQTATEDLPFSLSLPPGSFADNDAGDTLSVSASGLPGWLSFDAVTHTFSGTPGNADVGRTTLTVTVTDAAGASTSNGFDLVVTNANDAPRFTSYAGTATAAVGAFENTSAAARVQAVDDDIASTLSYAIAGGADAALVRIDGSTGRLEFIAAPDREQPADANGDGRYEVQVSVTDGQLTAYQALSIAVLDVNEPPIVTAHTLVISEAGATFSLTAQDVDTVAASLRYQVEAVAGGHFERIDGAGAAVLSFSQADIDAAHLIFVRDGSGLEPAYRLTLSDGASRVAVDAPAVRVVLAASTPALLVAAEQAPSQTTGDPKAEVAGADRTAVPELAPRAELAPVAAAAATDIAPVYETLVPVRGALGLVGQPTAVTMIRSGADRPLGEVGADVRIEFGSSEDGAAARSAAIDFDLTSSPAVRSFTEQLDRVRQEVAEADHDDIVLVGSASALATGLSAGYVLWLVRGGVLLASLMSSVPAWAAIDPLPVLAQMRRGDDDESGDQEGESIDPIEELFGRARRLLARPIQPNVADTTTPTAAGPAGSPETFA